MGGARAQGAPTHLNQIIGLISGSCFAEMDITGGSGGGEAWGQPPQLARGHGGGSQEHRDSEAAAAQIPRTAGVGLAPRSCH